jgi:antitoxin (DNA-binding transcriptional repressor) of toxin-antitoxin stability system
MGHVNTVNARAQFSEIINRAAFGKERVTLMRCAKEEPMPPLLPLQRPNRSTHRRANITRDSPAEITRP